MKREAPGPTFITHLDDLPDMVTPDEARAFLRISRPTIYNLIKSGALPHCRFGKLIRIPKTALMTSRREPLAKLKRR